MLVFAFFIATTLVLFGFKLEVLRESFFLPPFPDYPPDARVVSDDGVSGILRPLFGPDTPIPFFDRPEIRAQFSWIGIELFVVGFVLLIYLTVRKHPIPASLKFAFLLSASIAWDTLFPESLSQIGPLASISRIIPGLFYFSLPAFAVFITLCLYFLYFWRNSLISASGMFCIVLLCSAFYQNNQITSAALLSKSSRIFLSRISNLANDSNISPAKTEILDRVSVSPSKAILRELGLNVIDQRVNHEKVDLSDSILSISVPDHPELPTISRMTDHDLRTRWSTRSNGQKGNEKVLVLFKRPVVIAGLGLSPGTFFTDFPRGLRVSKPAKCEAPLPPGQVLFDQRNWRGAIAFTAGGYPYYKHESVVEVFWDPPVEFDCILIEQIGTEPYFDWSIAEILFYR